MKKTWIYIALLILIFLLTGCASAPETPEELPEEPPVEQPVEQPVEPQKPVEKQIEPVTPVEIVNPVSEKDILAAESAINRADAAGAPLYSPDLFLEANEDLEEAKSLSENDPDKARELLASAIEKANRAYKIAVDAQVKQKIAKLRSLETKLNDIEAEKFAPDDYKIVKNRADQLILYLNNEDYENADKQYNSTLRAMQNLYDTLDNNIRWVKILDRDASAYMADGEEQEVFLWAPEELEKANYSYSAGISYYNNYKLKESEKSLKEAKYWAFHALRLSNIRKRQSQTDTLMMEALEELEAASRNRVMDENGNIREASPWEGKGFIGENPAPNTDAGEFSEDGSSLKGFDPDAEVTDENETSLINGTTSVLGDEQQMSLLEQAIELWKQGVKARSEGKYDIADEYFKQSKAYSEAYSANAVALEYIVKPKDTLWAIAAKKEILDNPFLWTKIWRRNNTIIENPDLIFPGQKLIIPPK